MDKKYVYPYKNLSLTDLEGEIWRDVPNFECYYMVSNLGRIKALGRDFVHPKYGRCHRAERIVKQRASRGSSLVFSSRMDGIQVTRSVARTVYSAFVEILPEKSMPNNVVVLYKDNDPKNVRVENLYVISKRDYTKRMTTEGKMMADVSNYTPEQWQKIRNSVIKSISQYTRKGIFIRSFDSQAEAERITGIRNTCIQSALKGRTKLAGGYIWRYGTSKKKLPSKIITNCTPSPVSRPARAVKQFDLDGNYMTTYRSISEAAKTNNIPHEKLSYYLRKSKRELGNYLWEYADE